MAKKRKAKGKKTSTSTKIPKVVIRRIENLEDFTKELDIRVRDLEGPPPEETTEEIQETKE